MVDRLGRKRSYTFGSLVMAILPLAYLLLEGRLDQFFYLLLPIRVVHGMGVALCFTSAFTYMTDVIPEARLNEGMGMFGTSGLMGMAVGPVIGEAVIRGFGFDAFFISGAALSGIAVLMHLPLAESYVAGRERRPTPSFFTVLFRPKIFIVTSLALLFGIGLAGYGSFVAPFAQELGLPFVSLYFLSYSAAAIITRIFGGRLADRVGEIKIVPYALAMTGLGLWMIVFLNGNLVLVLSGLVTGCGHGLLYPAMNILAIRGEPANIRGRINGAYTGGIDAGIFVGAGLLGVLGEYAGYRAIFLAAGTSLFLGLGLFLFEKTRGLRRTEE
jgi:MFS family permease